MNEVDQIRFYSNALKLDKPIDPKMVEQVLGKDGFTQRVQLVRLGKAAVEGHWPVCNMQFNSLSMDLPFSNGEIYNTTVYEGNVQCKDGPYVDYAMASLIGNRLAASYNILSHVDHATFEALKATDPAVIAAAFRSVLEK